MRGSAGRLFGVAEQGPPFSRRPGEHLRLGRRGEEAAERHLESRGYRVLERRYRTRAGEIDVIALDGSTLVFVEVKTRSSLTFGRPSEAVGPRKRFRIAAAASLYLASRGGTERPCRFDVVEVVEEAGGRFHLRLIKDAFDAG